MRQYAIAAAIVVGFAMVAAAIYFRPAAPASSEVGAAGAGPEATPKPSGERPATTRLGRAAPASAQPPAPKVSAIQREAAIRAALAPERARWRRDCWDKLAAGQPGAPHAHFKISFGFGSHGEELSRGFVSPREGTNPEVDLCINRLPTTPLRLPTAGGAFTAELSFEVP